MSTFVKICGLSDAENIGCAVQAGADAIGFVFFEKSPRNISLEAALRLKSQMSGDVLTVAVMLHPDADYCAHILSTLAPDVLQTDAGDFAYLEVPTGIERWPVIRENAADKITLWPERFVYEGVSSGHGESVDWARAAEYAREGEMMLAGGLSVANVGDAIRGVRPWGVDVSSAVESARGVKDPNKIIEFVTAAKAA